MVISQVGINLIKKWEGVRLTAYQDVVGVWTIGYGHTKGVYAGMNITQTQAEAFLKEDIISHVAYLKKVVKVVLTQNQFDALASFHFNLGAYVLQNDTTLLEYINNSKWQQVGNQMKKYVYAGGQEVQGLKNRRNDEVELFMANERSAIVSEARKHLGKPYSQGAGRLGPNVFDCSGLVYYVFLTATGKQLGTVTWAQDRSGERISVNEALPGDLYFWGVQGNTSHVAIAIGNGDFIHSPQENEVVKITNVKYFPPSFALRMDLKELPDSKFKTGDIVGFNSQAQTWVGGKSIGADNLAREYKVSKYNADGSLYIVTIDNAWGGNVNENDIEISKRSKLFKLGDLIGFKEQATTWTSGKAIGADNLARDYKVAKLNNDGTIYIKTTDDAWGGNAREQDIAISKRSKKVKVNDNVGFNSGASAWTSGKAIGEDNLARDYKVTKLLVDGTVLITTLDNSWSGLVYDKDIEINQRSKKFKVGEIVRFNSFATTWTSGTAIGADNLKREYVVTKLYVDGTIYVRTTDNAWGGNVFEKDIELSRRIKLNDVVRFINSDAVWTSGKPIGADNLLRDYVVKGFNSDGTVYLTVPDNSWGGNVYYKDIDVKK